MVLVTIGDSPLCILLSWLVSMFFFLCCVVPFVCVQLKKHAHMAVKITRAVGITAY